MLTCYITPTSGDAKVSGLDIHSDSLEIRKRIGYLPEHNPLYYDMYVKEYLQFVAKLNGLGKDTGARVEKMIELTGLSRERKKKSGRFRRATSNV